MKSYYIRGKKINAEGQEEFWRDVALGLWEPGSFDVLDRYLRPGKRFADIGAWNGVLSLYASALGATCTVLEPDEIAARLLEANWLINETPSWEISNYAIAAKNDVVELHNTPDGFGNSISTLLPARGPGEIYAKVAGITLQKFFGDLINSYALIKMDIEGGELLVIEQARDYLAKYKPTMFISFHPNWFPEKMKGIDMLSQILFRIYRCESPEGIEYNETMFREALRYTQSNHSFVFKSDQRLG